MSEFDLNIIHVPGKANVVADALSHHCDHAPDAQLNVAIGIESYLLDHIRLSQEVSEDRDFYEFRRHPVASESSMCLHESLVCLVNRQ